MKNNMYFGFLLILFTIPVIYLACLSDDLRPSYTLIRESGETLTEPLCDSMGTVLTTPNYTFTNVELGYIIKTSPNVVKDTFFENGVFIMSPFMSLAKVAGLDTTLVCDGTVLMDSLMSITGMISLGDSSIRL